MATGPEIRNFAQEHGCSDAIALKVLTLQATVEKYRKMAEHIFLTPQKSADDPHMERCAQCGLNIRDEVHKRVVVR